LLITASVAGLATTATAATLNVYTTDTANVLKSTFIVGETFLLKVTGDTQGAVGPGDAFVQLSYNGSITDEVRNPPGCTGGTLLPCTTLTQGNWFADKGAMVVADGVTNAIFQAGPRSAINVDTSVITLIATGIGVSDVRYTGTVLNFFGNYAYTDNGVDIPTGHSFTIVPEPGTGALLVLCLLGVASWRRARA
jgi:hypothetical protein